MLKGWGFFKTLYFSDILSVFYTSVSTQNVTKVYPNDLTQIASLAVDDVELLLIGPFLITGAGYYKQSPPPTES